MFKPILLATAALAAASLAGCNNKPEVINTTSPDPLAAELANRAAPALPPSVRETVSYRCKDNSLAFVNFMSDAKQVQFHATEDGTPIVLKSDTDGGPWSGNGITVSGTPKSITLTRDGKTLTCKG